MAYLRGNTYPILKGVERPKVVWTSEGLLFAFPGDRYPEIQHVDLGRPVEVQVGKYADLPFFLVRFSDAPVTAYLFYREKEPVAAPIPLSMPSGCGLNCSIVFVDKKGRVVKSRSGIIPYSASRLIAGQILFYYEETDFSIIDRKIEFIMNMQPTERFLSQMVQARWFV